MLAGNSYGIFEAGNKKGILETENRKGIMEAGNMKEMLEAGNRKGIVESQWIKKKSYVMKWKEKESTYLGDRVSAGEDVGMRHLGDY